MNRTRLCAMAAIGALTLAISGSIVAPSVGAEGLPAAMLASFKMGTVDAVYPSAIRISGTEYRVHAGAKIMDHKENEMALEEVFVQSEAKFHLNKMGEIDMMVVRRPQ
jgi:hypothetical protein